MTALPECSLSVTLGMCVRDGLNRAGRGRATLWLIAAALAVGPPCAATAAGPSSVYGTIALSYHSVFGPELDGKGYYQPNSADLFAVPEVSGGLGFRATAGLRYSTFAVGVAYSQSYHDGAWFGLDKEIVRRALLLEGAVPLPAWGSARPYLRGALGTEWVTVNEGYYHQYGELVFVADPTYFGLGGEGVIGIEYPLGSHVSLVADVGFHTFSLLQVSSNSGYRPDVNLNPSLLDMGLEACCGVSVMWTF